MKPKILLLSIAISFCIHSYSQHFINKAVITYDVKTNIKKTMGSGVFADAIKDKMPDLKTATYTLTFDHGKSIYKFAHWPENITPMLKNWFQSEENDVYYYNFDNGSCEIQKNISGTNLNIMDSIPKLQWKLVNENRIIAGFNCRKAQAILFDSVYVFAFYTEEILLPGGPASFHGLPGTILGITVPRLYTSYIATSVNVKDVDDNIIKPVNAKKSMTYPELKKLLIDRTKDWYSNDDADENKEINEQKQRFIWDSMM